MSETLTVRLLELEERLQEFERRSDELGAGGLGGTEVSPGSTAEILAQTEERIARLEERLEGARRPAHGPGSSVLSFPRGEEQVIAEAPVQGEFATDPFHEEEEQYFMDELSA